MRLVGPRVVLRELELSDVGDVFGIYSNDRVLTFRSRDKPTREEVRSMVGDGVDRAGREARLEYFVAITFVDDRPASARLRAGRGTTRPGTAGRWG
ncbi:hypothetical protein [Embleya sp. AB8]|uniref:hypothetical protein n=1 Tax=Embleya sp. AB8 TaxID=3156304 RepID=UPI003C72E8B3